MRVALLGATKGMGRALARRLAERGDALFLMGRDPEDLERSARDLEARGGKEAGSVRHAVCDLERPEGFAAALDAAEAALGVLDVVVVTAGLFASQEALELDTQLARRDGSAGGTLCVFSSVAGERGRKPVILYGAAKAGLSRYLEGLDHKFRARGLKTVCVKPGFVRTSMTEGLNPPPFAGEPDAVAAQVVTAIDRGRPVVYAPGIWALVMFAIRMLPRFVMRRIGF
ncbi:MAG TPA: SDR family NAD(P)-dependent oxidoreductase [Polyangia bacterium]|nr:SDR family NAD(P)-dependent oxidoreductase [Polyangia bacterium]